MSIFFVKNPHISKNPLRQRGELATTLAIISLVVMTIGIIVGTGSLEKVKKFFGFAAGEKSAKCYWRNRNGFNNPGIDNVSGEPYNCGSKSGEEYAVRIDSITKTENADNTVSFRVHGRYQNVYASSTSDGDLYVFSRKSGTVPSYIPIESDPLAISKPADNHIDIDTVPLGPPGLTIDSTVKMSAAWKSSWGALGCTAGPTLNIYWQLTHGTSSYNELVVDLSQYPLDQCLPTPTQNPEPTEPFPTIEPTVTGPIPSPTTPCPLNDNQSTSENGSPCPPTITPINIPTDVQPSGDIDPCRDFGICPSETPLPPSPTAAPQSCRFDPTAIIRDPLCNPITSFNINDQNRCTYGVSNDRWTRATIDDNPPVLNQAIDQCVREGKRNLNDIGPRYTAVFSGNSEYKVRTDLKNTLGLKASPPACCVGAGGEIDPSTGQRTENLFKNSDGSYRFTYKVGLNGPEEGDKANVKVFLGTRLDPAGKLWRDLAGTNWEVRRQECAGSGCPTTDTINVIPNSQNDTVKGLAISCNATQNYGWILQPPGYNGPYKATCVGKCTFDSINYVVDTDGNPISEADLNPAWGTANDKTRRQARDRGENPDIDKPFDAASFNNGGNYWKCNAQGAECKTSVHADNLIFYPDDSHREYYRKGGLASIKLYYDKTNWEVDHWICEGEACGVRSGTGDTVTDVKVDCATNVRYGWVLRDKRTTPTTEPTSPVPTSPVPTTPDTITPPVSCSFDSTNYVRDTSGNLITDFDFDKPNGTSYGTANNKKFVIQDKPQAFFKNGIFFLCDINGQNCKSKIHTDSLTFPTRDDGYQKGDLANVKLYYPGQTGGWRIIGQECRGVGCPSSTKSDGTIDDVSNQIKGIKIDCGTNVEYGWILEKSNSLTPTVTPPVPPTDVTLDMQLRFQGIVSQSQVGNVKSPIALVRIGLAEGALSEPVYNSGVEFSMDTSGIWHGRTTFNNISVDPTLKYKVLVKAPMHLQRKVCDELPPQGRDEQIEDVQFSRYLCRRDIANIVLSSGVNNLDFSNILEYTGDLPIPQDGVVNSYDIVAMREIIKSKQTTNPDLLELADLNRDGDVNADDQALIVAALQIAQDEYEVTE